MEMQPSARGLRAGRKWEGEVYQCESRWPFSSKERSSTLEITGRVVSCACKCIRIESEKERLDPCRRLEASPGIEPGHTTQGALEPVGSPYLSGPRESIAFVAGVDWVDVTASPASTSMFRTFLNNDTMRYVLREEINPLNQALFVVRVLSRCPCDGPLELKV